MLDSSAKSGIFSPENALEATDSDPRLQVLMRVHQGVTKVGMPLSVKLSVNPQVSELFATTCQKLLKLAKTRVLKCGLNPKVWEPSASARFKVFTFHYSSVCHNQRSFDSAP